MLYDAVMFDLDGTLADTLADIAAAGNHAFSAVGRPTYAVADYRTLAGQGIERLIRDGLGPDHTGLFEHAIKHFREHYAAHRYDQTAPFLGIAELLDALVEKNVSLAVMSNKPDEATADMVGNVFGQWPFAAVRGHRAGYPVKPDPKAALEICGELNTPPSRWVYVGDTDVDMQTGKRAGFFTVGVTWGFRDEAELRGAGADAMINRPEQLLTLLV